MKKVYVEIKDGFPINVDIQNAIDGFEYLSYDIKTYTRVDVLSGKMDSIAKKNPFVGSIDTINNLFKRINKYPQPIDFPKSIRPLLNRTILETNLNDFIDKFNENHPMFIKPKTTKLFDGILIEKKKHLNYLKDFDNIEIWVSKKINIISEHRAYVHKGKLIYCCNYAGDFKINPDYNYIEELISNYKNQPVAYTIDVAVLDNGLTTTIEFNDFWAIGSYGLYCINYAQMLVDRYNQIIN